LGCVEESEEQQHRQTKICWSEK